MMRGSWTVTRAASIGLVLTSCFCLLAPADSLPCATCPRVTQQDFGPWTFVRSETLSSNELELLGASDHWRCFYQHESSGLTASVTWITGRAGPLVIHQPHVCIGRDAFQPETEARQWITEEHHHQFRRQTFRDRAMGATAMTVVYGWNDGNGWSAPDYPRLHFVTAPFLHRLQITATHPTTERGIVRKQLEDLTLRIATLTDSRAADATRSQP